MENVKVIIMGLGAMGRGMADMLLKKDGVEIVGIVGRNKMIGTSMYDYISTPKGDRQDVVIGAMEDVIKEKSADVIDKIIKDGEHVRLTPDEFYYINDKTNELEVRVTSYLQHPA